MAASRKSLEARLEVLEKEREKIGRKIVTIRKALAKLANDEYWQQNPGPRLDVGSKVHITPEMMEYIACWSDNEKRGLTPGQECTIEIVNAQQGDSYVRFDCSWGGTTLPIPIVQRMRQAYCRWSGANE